MRFYKSSLISSRLKTGYLKEKMIDIDTSKPEETPTCIDKGRDGTSFPTSVSVKIMSEI